MAPAPLRNGKIIADLHSHPGNFYGREEVMGMLSSPGLVGLTHINNIERILTYEEALRLPDVTEIDRGFLAKMESSVSVGYFARTQETSGAHHILAVGFEGDYLPHYEDPRKSVEEIHKRNGIAILNHPYVTPNKDARIIKYRFIKAWEEQMVKELCDMVDEIEVFNAQCINPTYGIIVPNMKKANKRAEQLALEKGFKGVVSTDTHSRLEQVKICGIYIDERELCVDKLKENIQQRNFQNDYRRYVSKVSFARGMFGI